MKVEDLRQDYRQPLLRRAELAPDPLEQLRRWLQEAVEAELPEPTAMTLATADADGRPSARTVLLKGVDERGLAFYTNYGSRKARQLEANPQAALLFFWPELQRQVSIEGAVERTGREESETYFASRPRASCIGAWASRQSEVLASREVLEEKVAEVEATYPGDAVPLPPFWGGFRLAPRSWEFWQGRPSRLHDRYRYRRAKDGVWIIERLSP